MKKLTLHQLNKKHDKSDSYFQEMRIRNPKKFRYIMFIGYDNFVNEELRLKTLMANIYYHLKPQRELSKFYREYLTHIYPSSQSWLVSLDIYAFRQNQLHTKLNAIKRMKKVEKQFYKYIEKHNQVFNMN